MLLSHPTKRISVRRICIFCSSTKFLKTVQKSHYFLRPRANIIVDCIIHRCEIEKDLLSPRGASKSFSFEKRQLYPFSNYKILDEINSVSYQF